MSSIEFNNKAMYKLSYGLFVCTAVQGEKKNGCIINIIQFLITNSIIGSGSQLNYLIQKDIILDKYMIK